MRLRVCTVDGEIIESVHKDNLEICTVVFGPDNNGYLGGSGEWKNGRVENLDDIKAAYDCIFAAAMREGGTFEFETYDGPIEIDTSEIIWYRFIW